jgi:hypothetical protein
VMAPEAGTYHAILRWHDSGGVMLSADTQTWALPASTWTNCGVIATAPAGAVSARIVLEPVAVASGEIWHFDQMAVRLAPVLAGNLLSYNAQSVESDSTPWAPVAGCTAARSTAQAWEGFASLAVTATGGDATVQLVQPIPVTARQAYRVVPYIYSPGPAPTVDILYTWTDSTGATLATFVSRWTLGASAGWYAPIGSAVAPTGAVAVQIGVRVLAASTGTVFYLDQVLVAAGGLGAVADVVPGAYGARVSLQGLTTGGHTAWGLWRMSPDGTTTPVRGFSSDLVQQTITGDLAVAEDYEAPLGVLTTYLVVVDGGADGYLSSTSAPITLPEPPDTTVVIKDPGLPERWTTAVVETLPDWQRPARQSVNSVRGRVRPIVISDVRTSRTGSITLVTETAEERDQLWWVLDTGHTLLLQYPSTWHEPDMYVQVGDAGEAHVVPVATYSDREWTASLTEVDRPVGGIVGSASRTWQSVLDANSDWREVLAGADSWLDVLTGVRGG